MSRLERTPQPEVDPLWQSAKALDEVPDAARERALVRARAIATAPTKATNLTSPGRLRLALAASGVLAIGATAALAAFLSARSPVAVMPVADDSLAVARHESLPQAPPAPEPVEAAPSAHAHAAHRRASSRGELELIQGAQASYADGRLSAALQLLAEHARRFPNGRLAEEREALRVRALERSGREDEADVALQAFAARFPHSLLLPHLREALAAPTAH